MFDIGFSEVVLVCIVGLVVLGPQRLPVAIRTVMSWVRTVRGLAANVQNELKQELKLQELQDSIKKAESLNLKALSPELGKTVEELKASADKLRADLEQKAAQSNTTLQDQIKEMKSAVEKFCVFNTSSKCSATYSAPPNVLPEITQIFILFPNKKKGLDFLSLYSHYTLSNLPNNERICSCQLRCSFLSCSFSFRKASTDC